MNRITIWARAADAATGVNLTRITGSYCVQLHSLITAGPLYGLCSGREMCSSQLVPLLIDGSTNIANDIGTGPVPVEARKLQLELRRLCINHRWSELVVSRRGVHREMAIWCTYTYTRLRVNIRRGLLYYLP